MDRRRHSRIAVILAVLFLSSCTNELFVDIGRAVDEVKGRFPTISAFLVSGLIEGATNHSVIDLDLSGNGVVAGWLVTESADAPDPLDALWSEDPPEQYTLSEGDGEKSITAYARDTADRISDPASFTVYLDTTAPEITAFTLESSAITATRDVSISLTASDTHEISYLVNEDETEPATDAAGWVAQAPESYTVQSSGDGEKTVYAWAKDVVGNVSDSATISLTVNEGASLPEVVLSTPSVTNSREVMFTITTPDTDIVAWFIKVNDEEDPEADDAGWLDEKPESRTLPDGDGTYVLSFWVRDGAGNISGRTYVSITLDRQAPGVDTFSLTSSTPTDDPTVGFTSTESDDRSGIVAWMLNLEAAAPHRDDSNWSLSAELRTVRTSQHG